MKILHLNTQMFGGTAIVARQLQPAVLVIALAGVAMGTVHTPWLIAGAIFGSVVLALAIMAPLALVAMMLVIGPIDLSFITGGFKSLFPDMGGLDMNGIRLLGATAGFIAYCAIEPRARAAAMGPLGRIWLLFLLFGAGTLLTSLDQLEGLRLLLKLAYPLLTFLIVVGLSDSPERVHTLMRYTLGAALLFMLLVNPILVWQGGYSVDYQGFLRIEGMGIGHSPFAFYCTAILLIVFARFTQRREWKYLLFSLILIAWIASTMTRIAALAAMVGMVLIAVMGAVAARNRMVLIVSLVLLAIAGAVMVPNVMARSLGFTPTAAELFDLLRSPVALFNAINWQGRDLLWAILWGAFMVSPVIGLGLGSSTAILRETFPVQSISVAHNEYMRLATDMGVLGVLLFFGAVVAWLIAMVRMIRDQDHVVREFALAAFGGIVAWALIAVTDNPLDYYANFTQYIAFFVAGAVVMHTHRSERPAVA